MPRGRLSKVDILPKLYKMKRDLHENQSQRSREWTEGAQDTLNKLIDFINEYHT
jgi:hypothetical protein